MAAPLLYGVMKLENDMSAVIATTRLTQVVRPGEVRAAWTPAILTTVVDTSVAVCLWDPQEGVGGITHFTLPEDAKLAIQELIEAVVRCGGRANALRASVYGGAVNADAACPWLGPKSVNAAILFLTKHGIEVAEIDAGGNRSRSLRFYTDQGTALVAIV